MILLVMALLLVAFFAAYTISRIGSSGDAREDTRKRLAKAGTALERYAAANSRLPCPANPALATGTEVTATASTCSNPDGTLPWATLGLNQDDGLDGWGRKVSYRVYTGAAGSLTQPGGASMVDCDTTELNPQGTDANGLCRASHDTTPDQFVAGKGLMLTDFGVAHNDVAYIVMSHGATGLGAWTVAGTQMDMPAGAERNNTNANGPFTIQAFSDPDTGATSAQHFDDQLAYAGIADLARRAGLYARNWPDDIAASVTFDRPTLTAALGSSPATDTGRSTIQFTNVSVTALSGVTSADSSGSAQDISFQGSGTNQGIGGVSGTTGLQSGVGGPDEAIRLDIGETVRQFAFALDGFGYQSTFFGFPIWIEQVELRFYTVSGTTATLRATATKSGCRADGGLATFSVNPGVDWTRVEIRPEPTTAFFGSQPTSFLLAEIKACSAAVTCTANSETASTACP